EAEWLAALPRLRQRVGERNFTTWIEPLQCSGDANGLRLEVSSRFFQEWITRHFLTSIREVLHETSGTTSNVRVVGVSGAAAADRRPKEAPHVTPRGPAPRTPKIGHVVPDYTFDTFIVGTANEGAYEAARAVATQPGRRFNPFFVWGGVGLGKTHLVN